MPVGSPVVAEDAEKDALTYTLTGDAADSFDINSATGQITVGAGTVLNFEGTADLYWHGYGYGPIRRKRDSKCDHHGRRRERGAESDGTGRNGIR